MTRKSGAPRGKTRPPLFEGDVQVQEEVRVGRAGGAARATLKKAIREKLALKGNVLSAATVEVSPGKSVLLLGADDVVGRLRINKSGESGFEVVADDGSEAPVDAETKAFVTLKAARFARGELNLAGPFSAEDMEALAAEEFRKAERLLDK